MKLSEAKLRNDYHFTCVEISKYIDEIRNNKMVSLYENGDPLRGVAVLEIGYIDIEVNITTFEQVGITEKGNAPLFNYFICLKHGDNDNDWESEDYLEYEINVNFKDDNWKEQLESDMFNSLCLCVNEYGYSFDSPN